MEEQRASADSGATAGQAVSRSALERALEASWDQRTAYRGVIEPGKRGSGQCYPTSRVVQWFYPEFEIAVGEVWTGTSRERHFWNVQGEDGCDEWLDFSWGQFPAGSAMERFEVLDRHALGDSPATRERCAPLLARVLAQFGGEGSGPA